MSGGLMGPEQRLQALEDLEKRQQRNQRRAVRAIWLSIVAGVMLLGGIVALASWQLHSVRTQLNALNVQKASLTSDINQLQQQKTEAEQQRRAAAGALNNVPEEQLQLAINKQFATAPQTAALLPRIYVHIVDKADSDRAKTLRGALQEAGYLVLGIEYVPKAAGLKTTDVRFYRTADRGEAEKIAAVLKKAGEAEVNLNFLLQYQNDASVKPNHFEVWLAHRAG